MFIATKHERRPLRPAAESAARPRPDRPGGSPASDPCAGREDGAGGAGGAAPAACLDTLFARYTGRSHSIKLARKEVVYSEGQTDQNIYFIEFGQVKAVVSSPSGRSCLLSIRTAGDCVGELGLLHPCRRETVTTMKPTRLRCVPIADFRAALVSEGCADEFLCYLLGQISAQQAMIANMVTMNSEQRLAATILELAAKIGTPRGDSTYINGRITQEELSAMVGTTRSRVGLFLKRFKASGMIAEAGFSVAVDEEKLRRYLQDSAWLVKEHSQY